MILLGESTQIKIQTQMRTDITHLQHAVGMWPCFTKENAKVKMLYIKSVGFLSTVNKLDVFEKVLKYILVVAYSETYNDNCQKAMQYLINLIQTFTLDLNNSTIVNKNEKVDDHNVLENEDDNKKDSLTHTYIEAIKSAVISKISNEKHSNVGIQKNDYNLPNFGDKLVELSKEFVRWTNVMQEHFKNPHYVSSSARSETCSGELKRSLLHMTLRQDKFLVSHCRQTEADMKLARAAINNIKFENKIKQSKLDYNTEQLMVVERWKNKFSNIDFEDLLDDADSSILIGKNNSTESIIEKKDSQINDDAKNHDFSYKTNTSEDYNVAQEVIIHTSLEDHNYSRFQHQLKMHSSALLLEEKSLPEEKNLTQDENPIGKTETVEKPRGIHVRPNTEIALRLQQSKNTKSNGKKNITNGNKQTERAMKKQKIKFLHTCAFDTLTEIFSSACCSD